MIPSDQKKLLETIGSDKALDLLRDHIAKEAIERVKEYVSKATKELQEVIGPHGSVSRMQAGGVKIERGIGVAVYDDGTLKTSIKPSGDMSIGSNIENPADTTFSVFVTDQTYNNEEMGEGDILFGDNSEGVSNVKWDQSEGRLLFRYGTDVNLYIDTDGSIVSVGGTTNISGGLHVTGNLLVDTAKDPQAIVFTDASGYMDTDPDFQYQQIAYAPGTTVSSGTVNGNNASGVQITGLTPWNWYCIEGAGGPWHAGVIPPYDGDFYSFELSLNGSAWSGVIGWRNDTGAMDLTLPSFAAYAEAVTANYGRVYFRAPGTSVWFRCADASFGDNTGTLGYTIKNATVGLDRIMLNGTEYTALKLPLAIHGATEKTSLGSNDEVAIFDYNTGELRKVLGSNVGSGWECFNVKIYGAVGDGSTDDTAAIAAAVSALNSAGRGVLYFPPGSYLTSGNFTISVDCIILGAGASRYFNSSSSYISRVLCNSATASLFTITADYGFVKDLALVNVAASTPSNGAGITVTSSNVNQRVNYENLELYGFYNNIDVQVGTAWSMFNCDNNAPVKYCVRIRNTVNVDAGDWSIVSCWFSGFVYNSDAGIRVESSGGGKIINCKFNGASASDSFLYGIDLTSAATTTGNFQVSNNSIENVRSHGIKIAAQWHDLVIVGNQFGLSYNTANNTGNAINVSGNWDGIVIANNSFTGGSTPTAVSLSNINNAVLVGNVNRTFSGMLTQSGCTNVLDLSSVAAISSATPQDVGSTAAAGTGTAASADDHVHEGVHSVNGLTGDVTITSGELLMQDGVSSPPVPLTTEDGTDWLYQG